MDYIGSHTYKSSFDQIDLYSLYEKLCLLVDLAIPRSLFLSGNKPWSNIMNLLDEKDGGDSELLVYAMTLLNKVSEEN